MFTLHTIGLTEPVSLKNLPTLRQTFALGSLLIVASYLLEGVYPIAHWLPLLPAMGLMFSAVFGVCPMVLILQKLPWNKP